MTDGAPPSGCGARDMGSRAAGQILVRFGCGELVERILPTLATTPLRAFRLYRSHISSPISQAESEYRTSLDELIEMCSLLSIVTGDIRATLGSYGAPTESILQILCHPAVERYITVHYPMPYGIIARADLLGTLPRGLCERQQSERRSAEWATEIEGFFLFNAQILSDESLLNFLFLLDDHFVGGVHISELQLALANKEEMAAWLEDAGRAALLDGLERFLDFAEGLDHYLGSLDEFPVLRGRVWFHYSYWFGHGGARIREIIAWLIGALEASGVVSDGHGSPTVELKAVFDRLTNPYHYCSDLIAQLDPLEITFLQPIA